MSVLFSAIIEKEKENVGVTFKKLKLVEKYISQTPDYLYICLLVDYCVKFLCMLNLPWGGPNSSHCNIKIDSMKSSQTLAKRPNSTSPEDSFEKPTDNMT